MPYRSSRVETPKLTAEAGIVDDMVRQFADRYAFLRELVQNGIDAGATRIEVRVERGPDGVVTTSVADDGCGMSRAVIEGPLLTLFESSKESDSTKIGKYGIGFVSVFALEPERVDVRTRTGAESWVVRLLGDHSFELMQGTRSGGTGTEVVLVHTMTVEELVEHARRAREALVHWCRHAHIPITLAVVGGERGAEVVTVNTPLAVHGAATVSIVEGDERFVVGVGDPGPRGAGLEWMPSFCGLYNHGLTLLETSDCEPGLACIRFKIDSPKLAHTLSRDNVRRDGEHRRLLERVRTIVAGPLLEELRRGLGVAAKEAAAGGCERYTLLLEAALAPPIREHADRVPVPLVDPIDGRTTMDLDVLRRARAPIGRTLVLVAEQSSPLTWALAGAGRPVIRHLELGPILRRITGEGSVMAAEHACAFAAAAEARDEDAALSSELARLLHAAGREIQAVRLAVFSGVGHGEMSRVVRADDAELARAAVTALSSVDDARKRPWGRCSTLFVNAEHDTVRLARRRARGDVAMAAQLLCRALLLTEGPLEKHAVDGLLRAAGSRGPDVRS